jgi:Protein of unknown function (DUF3592)
MGKGKIFLSLFMLPFLGVALWMGFMTFQAVQKVEQARGWKEVPAEITSCVLHRNRGSKGGYSYRVEAHYTYTVDSKKYTSSKVSFYSGSDNIGRFHQDIFFRLETARTSQKSFPCWVNPADPWESVLIRDLRPEMMAFHLLFVVMFGGAAIGLLCASLISIDSKRLSNGNLRMRKAGVHRPVLACALLADAGAGWLLWKVAMLSGLSNLPWYLLLTILPGLILTVIGLYMWRRFSKFGISELMLSSATIRLGDRITATVMIPKMVEGDFKGVLACTHQYTTGSGKHRSTHHVVLWSSELLSGGSPAGADMTHVSFTFALPTGGCHVTQETGSTKYYWQLVITSDLPGVDYRAEFDIVVV